MKKTELLHAEISEIIAKSAHGDMIMIGDAGMPVPEGVKFIDLALTEGMVPFFDVLDAVLKELCVEEAYIDLELKDNEEYYNEMYIHADKIKINEMKHEELKEMSKNCVAAIRTGEFTPYSNIILKSGVVF